MIISEDGFLHILESVGGRISVFRTNGKLHKIVRLDIPAKPNYFTLGENGEYFLSYWMQTNDKVIHKFSSNGDYINSFGDAIDFTKPLTMVDQSAKININFGVLSFKKGNLYFSRRNPYEILKFSSTGKLQMYVLRENTFMPPFAAKIFGKDAIALQAFASTTSCLIWRDKIINQVNVPNNISKDIHTAIDIFELNGQLIATKLLKPMIFLYYIDDNDRAFGKIFDNDGVESVVRWSIKLD